MGAEFFWIECAGCRLTWKMSLMECEVGRSVACPFCGNQHFSEQTTLLSSKDYHGELQHTEENARKNAGVQFTWI